MFESRLKASLIFLGVILLVLVGRLVDLQVVHANYYRQEAERALLTRPRQLPAARGRILDRTGQILVSDEPCWDILLEFDVIAAGVNDDPDRMDRLVRRCKRARRFPKEWTPTDMAQALRQDLGNLWHDLAACAPAGRLRDADAIRAEAKEIFERVVEIRRIVAARRGFDSPVAEELSAHAVISGLNAEQQIQARERLSSNPWVSLEASSKRAYGADSAPFAHIMGRLGRVDAAQIAADRNADDPFARYLPDERLGTSGVEAAAESTLRGRRGQVVLDRDGNLAEEIIESESGRDVTLTLNGKLQRRLYQMLGDKVRSIPESSGGAIVALDVATREVLALVSYPSYEPDKFDELFPQLRDDTERAPLNFRAVGNRYAPGSIVKPLVCLAGLMNGRITIDSQEQCSGYLLPDHPDKWRCWEIHGTNIRRAHGSIDVVEALTGSCNVFMYRLGEKLGVDALCDAFNMVGIGRSTGIGLREENFGINPTPEWLQRERHTGIHAAHARLFAIGQGEVCVAPVQAANLAATYASGTFRHISLIRGAGDPREWTLPASQAHWAAIRQGTFGVVNDPGGTAYKDAHWENERYCLCGKTGSATAASWPTAFRVPYVDATGARGVALVRAGAKNPACRRFESEFPEATYDPSAVEMASTWPRDATPESDYAHAWFAGYLQRIDDRKQPIPSEVPRVAFAVLVEFGGSGGRVSGPIARDVASILLEILGPELTSTP